MNWPTRLQRKTVFVGLGILALVATAFVVVRVWTVSACEARASTREDYRGAFVYLIDVLDPLRVSPESRKYEAYLNTELPPVDC